MVREPIAAGEESVESLVAQSSDVDADVRRTAIYKLKSLMKGKTVDFLLPVLRPLLTDPSPDVRISTVSFFSQRPELNDVVDVLQDMAANDPSLAIRVAASNVLAWR